MISNNIKFTAYRKTVDDGEKQSRYKFGDYILRERKGRYYVYKLEYENGDVKETYVGSLTDVVESYLKLKENSIGVLGYPPQWGRRDLNPGPPAIWWLGIYPQAGILVQARLRPHHLFHLNILKIIAFIIPNTFG